VPESSCDLPMNQRRLCILTSETIRRIGLPHEAPLGRSAFSHQEPEPGGDVWIVDVDTERIAGFRDAVTQGVAVHAQVTRCLCPLPMVAQVRGHCRNEVLALHFEEVIKPGSDQAGIAEWEFVERQLSPR
jgi:hypothetical protein